MIWTPRLLLRPARVGDLDDLHAVFSDPDTMRYWDRPAYDDIATTKAFLDGLITQDPEQSLDLIVEHQGRCVGKAGMWRLGEIGYILNRSHWRQGLAFEAFSALLPHLFERFPKVPELRAECDPRNTASVKLLQKLGFRKTRSETRNFLYGGVEWCDTDYFALCRADLSPVSSDRPHPDRPR